MSRSVGRENGERAKALAAQLARYHTRVFREFALVRWVHNDCCIRPTAAPASALGREPSFSDFRVAEGGRIVRWVEKLALFGARSESSIAHVRAGSGLVVGRVVGRDTPDCSSWIKIKMIWLSVCLCLHLVMVDNLENWSRYSFECCSRLSSYSVVVRFARFNPEGV